MSSIPSVTAVSGVSGASSSSSASGTSNRTSLGGNSQELQASFLKLLVTQLQNQDPTNPMDSSQMTTQLAQLSQLQQSENINSNLSSILLTERMGQATSMVGRTVAFLPAGQSQPVAGKVDGVQIVNGQVQLIVGQNTVAPDAVLAIQ